MTCDKAASLLQDLVDAGDDHGGGVDRGDLDQHLSDCEACRVLAADLSAIVSAAAALGPVDPPEHLWLQLAGRWRRERTASAGPRALPAPPARRGRRLWPLLAAAAILTVAAGGSWIAWQATGGTTVILEKAPAAARSGNATDTALVESAQKDIEAAEELYARAIAGLEQAAESQRDLLDPHVVTALDRSLQVIDAAIAESRAAARSQPQSVVARDSLFEAFRQKVSLLQNTISLVSEISNGNQAAAARITGT